MSKRQQVYMAAYRTYAKKLAELNRDEARFKKAMDNLTIDRVKLINERMDLLAQYEAGVMRRTLLVEVNRGIAQLARDERYMVKKWRRREYRFKQETKVYLHRMKNLSKMIDSDRRIV